MYSACMVYSLMFMYVIYMTYEMLQCAACIYIYIYTCSIVISSVGVYTYVVYFKKFVSASLYIKKTMYSPQNNNIKASL